MGDDGLVEVSDAADDIVSEEDNASEDIEETDDVEDFNHGLATVGSNEPDDLEHVSFTSTAAPIETTRSFEAPIETESSKDAPSPSTTTEQNTTPMTTAERQNEAAIEAESREEGSEDPVDVQARSVENIDYDEDDENDDAPLIPRGLF